MKTALEIFIALQVIGLGIAGWAYSKWKHHTRVLCFKCKKCQQIRETPSTTYFKCSEESKPFTSEITHCESFEGKE